MKKGFTLIELLATIVILAVIAVIAVPSVLGVVNDVKKSAFLSSELAVKEAATNYVFHNINTMPINIGDVLTLPITDLSSQGYIKIKDDCGGFVNIVKQSNNDYAITPFMKCGTGNNVTSAIDDKLVLHYKFDDFQEPTVNLFQGAKANMTVDTVYSTIGGTDYIGNYFIKPNPYLQSWEGIRVPGINVASGKKYTFSMDIMANSAFNIGVDLNVSGTGYVGNDAGRDYGFYTPTRYTTPNEWSKVILTAGVRPDLLNAVAGDSFCPTDAAILNQKIYYKNWQLEQKEYSTEYTPNTRLGTVQDYSGRNIDSPLDLNTTPRWINNSYYFNGVDTSINLPNNMLSTIDVRNNGLTYSIWIKPDQLTEQRIIGQQISSAYSDYSNGGIGITSLGKAVMIAYSDANPSGYIYEESTTTLSTTNWNHIVGVYDNVLNQLKIYVNGKLDSTPSTIGTFSRLISVDTNRIGRKESAPSNYYKGYLDEVRVYNRVLNDEEVEKIYKYESKFKQ